MKSILEMRKDALDYTECQREALLKVESFIEKKNKQVFVLSGYSGTGKTISIENIVNKAQSCGRKVFVLAFTNKAVMVLKSKLVGKINLDSKKGICTIHSFLYGQPDEETGEWTPSHRMKPNDFIIIDEASMVDKNVYDDLMRMSNGASFVFVGDPFQLKPINGDSIIFNRIDYEMTTVKRQDNTSDVLKYATALRTVKKPFFPDSSQGEVEILDKDTAFDKYTDLVIDGEDCIYIVATNKSRNIINSKTRQVLYQDKLEPVNLGERLISIANSNYRSNADLFDFTLEYKPIFSEPLKIYYANGGMSEEVTNGYLFEKDREYLLIVPDFMKASLYHQQIKSIIASDGTDLDDLLFTTDIMKKKKSLNRNVTIATYGFCISGHKSQGSEFSYVFVDYDFFHDDPNWLYTVVTRTRDKLYLVDRGIERMDWFNINNFFGMFLNKDRLNF